MDEQYNYDMMDTRTLSNLLLSPFKRPEVHRAALSALSRRGAAERNTQLIAVLRSVVLGPEQYNQDVMMGVIEILATDPDADATAAMLEMLPAVLEKGIDGKDSLKPEFREYYYQALVTRQREDDLAVWGEMLPQLDAKALVGAAADPMAKALDALEPMTLIDRLPEPTRTTTLISVILAVARVRKTPERAVEAAKMLKSSHDKASLKEGLKVAEQQWDKAKKAKRETALKIFKAALRVIDGRPRSPGERLSGKRPWAP